MQFIFDSKTGKQTPNDPPAISPEPGHGPRHMVFSPDNKNLYVVNELSGHVTQYAVDSGKGTLTLIESTSSVPADAGLAWGTPQAPVGAAPTGACGAPQARPASTGTELMLSTRVNVPLPESIAYCMTCPESSFST